MKKLLTGILLVLSLLGYSQTKYIDPTTAKNKFTGTQTYPLKSDIKFESGTTYYFKRGTTFDTTRLVIKGNNITISSYGAVGDTAYIRTSEDNNISIYGYNNVIKAVKFIKKTSTVIPPKDTTVAPPPSKQLKAYYVNNQGNDSNDGKTLATAWKSTDKVNNSMNSFIAGDTILFAKGQTFTGSLVVTKPGLYIGSYGVGNLPKISGSKQLSTWTRYNGSIWTTSLNGTSDSILNLYTNGIEQPLGRTPNTGYYRITNVASGSILRDNTKTYPTANYWQGANISVNLISYIVNTYKVTASTTTGNITTNRGDNYEVDHGFFLTNHINTLDLEGEWCITAGKVYLYSTTDPNTKTIDVNYNRYGAIVKANNTTIEGMEFTKHKTYGILLDRVSNVTIKNNIISYSGGNGIKVNIGNKITVEGNTITNSNNSGIEWLTVRDGLIKDNLIKNTSMVLGKGWNDNEQNCAIILFRWSYGDVTGGSRNTIIGNRIDSTGYNGIHFLWNDTVIVKNNYITNVMLKLDDGGAIYYVRDEDEPLQREIKIIDNIVDYSYGNNEGTPDGYYTYWDNHAGEGIYLDNRACYATVIGNTVTRTAKGLYIHSGRDILARNNTFYNNWTSNYYIKEQDAGMSTDNKFYNNYLHNDKLSSGNGYYQYYIRLDGETNFWSTMNNRCDSNYISSYYTGDIFNGYSPSVWQSSTGQDKLSTVKTAITNTKLVYNPTKQNLVIQLDGIYKDFNGNNYSSLTLLPFTSKILYK